MSMGFSAHVGLMLSFLYAGISDVMRKWVCFGAYAVTPVTYFGVVLCCVCVWGGGTRRKPHLSGIVTTNKVTYAGYLD
jgi:hypothetical protein